MVKLTDEMKQKIRLAHDARRPHQSKSGDTILSFGGHKTFKVLVKNSVATPAGKYWESISGEQLPTEGWDRTQTPFRKGRSDYIQTNSGPQVVRKWNMIRNRYEFTKLGRRFYAQTKKEYTPQSVDPRV